MKAKTPVKDIKRFIEIFRNSNLSPEVRDMVEKIYRATIVAEDDEKIFITKVVRDGYHFRDHNPYLNPVQYYLDNYDS